MIGFEAENITAWFRKKTPNLGQFLSFRVEFEPKHTYSSTTSSLLIALSRGQWFFPVFPGRNFF